MDVGNLISGFTRVWPKEQSSPWGLDLSFPGWFLLGGVLMRGEGSGGVGWTQTLSLQSSPCTAIDLPISCHVQGFFRLILLACWVVLSCLTLCDPMDYSPPGSSVHGISQARKLEWVAISTSKGSYRPRDRTGVSCIFCIGRQILYHCATWEAPKNHCSPSDMLGALTYLCLVHVILPASVPCPQFIHQPLCSTHFLNI